MSNGGFGLHVLWVSDSPQTPSGFGNVTRFVCAGLAARGHRVDILGWQTLEEHDWNGCRVLPRGTDGLGADVMFSLLVKRRPDIVVALGDVWWMPYFTAPNVRRQMELCGTLWALYYPIDGDCGAQTLPPSWIEMLREVDVPIAMSAYGRDVSHAGGVRAHYIPHGVDTEIFAPPVNRDAAKAELGYADRFLLLSDSRNQPRKMIPRLLDIVRRVADRVPETLLHLHTDPDDEFTRSGYYGYDVRADVRHLGLENHVRFTPDFTMSGRSRGIPLERLANYYRAADVHVLASTGEGFGLPTLQAAAAGAIPAGGGVTATRELVEGHGLALPIVETFVEEFGLRRALVDVDAAADAIAALAHRPQERADRSARCRAFAEPYAWPNVVAAWDGLLRDIERRRRRGETVSLRSSANDRKFMEQRIVAPGNASVTVRMRVREAGRIESAIYADTNKRIGSVRVPALPAAFSHDGFRVTRDPRSIAVAAGSEAAFHRLAQLFPMLEALPLDAQTFADSLDLIAHAILLLDLANVLLPAQLTIAAALGLPAMTPSAQAASLWPELRGSGDPVDTCRTLFTNNAFMARVSEHARGAGAAVTDLARLSADVKSSAKTRRAGAVAVA